ncbi:hypothetical protein [Streptomyces sp. NPDC050848]|uniref:hypothetical protein n=1 Tax=Streptomyces sp. NPDC050848 TaxID=3155791 RepID=UPI0033F50483
MLFGHGVVPVIGVCPCRLGRVVGGRRRVVGSPAACHRRVAVGLSAVVMDTG